MRWTVLRFTLENQAEGSCSLADERSVSGPVLGEPVAKVVFAVSGSGSKEYSGLPLNYRLEKDGKSWSPNFKCVKCRSQLILICGNHPPGSLRRRKEEECARYIRCPHCDGLIDTHTK